MKKISISHTALKRYDVFLFAKELASKGFNLLILTNENKTNNNGLKTILDGLGLKSKDAIKLKNTKQDYFSKNKDKLIMHLDDDFYSGTEAAKKEGVKSICVKGGMFWRKEAKYIISTSNLDKQTNEA